MYNLLKWSKKGEIPKKAGQWRFNEEQQSQQNCSDINDITGGQGLHSQRAGDDLRNEQEDDISRFKGAAGNRRAISL